MRARSGVAGVCRRTRLHRAFLSVMLVCVAAASAARAQVSLNDLRTWGLETYDEIDRTLRVPGTQLFAETVSLSGVQYGGHNGRAYVWPASTQFRVFNTLVQIEPTTFNSTLRQFADELHTAYWEIAPGQVAATDSTTTTGTWSLRWWRPTALPTTASTLTVRSPTHAFVLQGEDSVAGGGIYFRQFDFSSKDAISTLQAARGAAMLYRETGQQSYLDDATRLLTWAQTHLQRSDGMFSERWNISTNSPEGFDLVELRRHRHLYKSRTLRCHRQFVLPYRSPANGQPDTHALLRLDHGAN